MNTLLHRGYYDHEVSGVVSSLAVKGPLRRREKNEREKELDYSIFDNLSQIVL